jgi:hypothetical protein
MPEHEAPGRAVYDHDNEEPRPAGRRRRQVADWGVGEELFDGMPGRRFERRPHQEIPRGDAGDGRRTIVIETGDAEVAHEIPPAAHEEFASRDEALRARERHDELWGGDEPFADAGVESAERPVESWAADDPPFGGDSAEADEQPLGGGRAAAADAPQDRWAAADAWAAEHDRAEAGHELAAEADEPGTPRADRIVRGGQEGRRTVKIGGRPAEFHGPPARARRRPPRTVHERLGPRPERIVAWAFALGVLLILIAIATANV